MRILKTLTERLRPFWHRWMARWKGLGGRRKVRVTSLAPRPESWMDFGWTPWRGGGIAGADRAEDYALRCRLPAFGDSDLTGEVLGDMLVLRSRQLRTYYEESGRGYYRLAAVWGSLSRSLSYPQR